MLLEAVGGDCEGVGPIDVGVIGKVLLYGLAAIGIGLLVFLLYGLAGRNRFRPRESAADPAPAVAADAPEPEGPWSEISLATAERLAGDGRYNEAIHLILLCCLQHAGQALRRSLTAREAIKRIDLGERAQAAFAAVVRTSERGHFGGHHLHESDFRMCLQNYQMLAEAAGSRN